MHCGSAGSGLPPGLDALAPAVAVIDGADDAEEVVPVALAVVLGAALAVAVGIATDGDAFCAAVGMLAVGAVVVPVGSARWHPGKTARARRYRARRRTSS